MFHLFLLLLCEMYTFVQNLMIMRKFFFFALILGMGLVFESKAQSRLVPVCRYDGFSSGELKEYRMKFDELLLSDRDELYFAFTVRPSWGAPSSCRFDASTSEFVLQDANENIWFYYFGSHPEYKEEGSPEVEVMEHRCKVSRDAAKCFMDLFFAAVFSSSYTAASTGLDGVTYELFFDRGWYAAEFWSPDEGTNCYELKEVLDKLSAAVRANDTAAIEALLPDVKKLTKVFRKLLPKDIKEPESQILWYDMNV